MRLAGLTLSILLSLAWAAHAADLSGAWQTEKPRYVLKIRHASGGGYSGEWFNLGDMDGMLNGNPQTIGLDGNTLTLSPLRTAGTFTGRLSPDGQTITGSWTQSPTPLVLERATAKTAHIIDPSPHKVRFVTVQPGVKLEVLDWGGSGPPLIFLAGLGRTAHSFDDFAGKFTAKHHVYAITRRGFGISSWPAPTDENYDADRLGDDVLAVMDALHIEKPVIAGHSIAGEELSSIGTRHPEKIAGLIYLDSLFQYAFANPDQADLSLNSATVRRDLDSMFDLQDHPAQWRALIADVQARLPKLQAALQDTSDTLAGAPDATAGPQRPMDLAGNKIFANTRPYGAAPVPVLALLAMPKRCEPVCDTPNMKRIMAGDAARADLYEKTAPHARVVRIAKASHYIWRSNEAQVEQEMNTFMDGLH